MSTTVYWATGRRKESVARVRLVPGEGKITVNGQDVKEYFGRDTLEMLIRQPFQVLENGAKFNVIARVEGGGKSGQAGALRHGIARALVKWDQGLKTALSQGGFLTRDPRMKERKKYGQKGARAHFQYSKR